MINTQQLLIQEAGLKSGDGETIVWASHVVHVAAASTQRNLEAVTIWGWERSDWSAVTSQETLCWKTSHDLVCLQETEQYLSRNTHKKNIYLFHFATRNIWKHTDSVQTSWSEFKLCSLWFCLCAGAGADVDSYKMINYLLIICSTLI